MKGMEKNKKTNRSKKSCGTTSCSTSTKKTPSRKASSTSLRQARSNSQSRTGHSSQRAEGRYHPTKRSSEQHSRK